LNYLFVPIKVDTRRSLLGVSNLLLDERYILFYVAYHSDLDSDLDSDLENGPVQARYAQFAEGEYF
jgi:hypothetical protein